MFKWLGTILCTLRSVLHSQRELALENLVLRQQLAALKHRYPRPRLTDTDRLFWYGYRRFGLAGEAHFTLFSRIRLFAGIAKVSGTTGDGRAGGVGGQRSIPRPGA
jgi:hypothetical protein